MTLFRIFSGLRSVLVSDDPSHNWRIIRNGTRVNPCRSSDIRVGDLNERDPDRDGIGVLIPVTRIDVVDTSPVSPPTAHKAMEE